MKGFIEVTHVGKRDGHRYRTLIAVSEIISVGEYGQNGTVTIQMERNKDGKIPIGIEVAETFEKVASLIAAAQ